MSTMKSMVTAAADTAVAAAGTEAAAAADTVADTVAVEATAGPLLNIYTEDLLTT